MLKISAVYFMWNPEICQDRSMAKMIWSFLNKSGQIKEVCNGGMACSLLKLDVA